MDRIPYKIESSGLGNPDSDYLLDKNISDDQGFFFNHRSCAMTKSNPKKVRLERSLTTDLSDTDAVINQLFSSQANWELAFFF